MKMNSNRKRSFTFVELVIIVITLAVLVMAALPAVNAKGNAMQVSCTGNLKQLYSIEVMYAQDNDDYICPNAVNRKGHGRHRIPYANGRLEIFHCPDAVDAPYAKRLGKGSWPEIPAGKRYIEGTYMRNSSIGGWEPFKTWHAKARRFKNCRNPEMYVMIFDGNLAQGTWEAIRYNAATKRSRGVEYRHDNTANTLFQDGHIAPMTPEKFKGGRGIGSPDAKGKDYIFASR